MESEYTDHVEAVSHLKGAEEAFRRGEYPQARSMADSCVAIDPSLCLAWELLGLMDIGDGDLLSAQGNFEMALTCSGTHDDTDTALEVIEQLGDIRGLGPDETAFARSRIGSAFLQRRRYHAALAIYSGLMDGDEGWELLSTVAFLRREIGMLEEALELYDRAIDIDGAPPEIMADAAVTLIKLGRLDEAEGALETALEAGVVKPMVWNNLGFVREARQDLEGALEAYESAISLDPRYYPALYSKGRVLQRMGRMKDAKPFLEQGLDLEGRVYGIEDVRGREEREESGGIHAKEIMPPTGDDQF